MWPDYDNNYHLCTFGIGRGLRDWVCRNPCKVTDRKILAMLAENAAPTAVPLICWKENVAK